MRRRQLLAYCGVGITGLAGCVGTADDDSDGGDGGASGTRTTSTTTRTTNTRATTATTTARTPVPAPNVSVERERVFPEMVALSTPDLSSVYGSREGRRFVLVAVDATAESNPPAREAFSLAVGDRTYTPTTDVGGWSLEDYHGLGTGTIYAADRPVGDLVFAAAPTDVERTVTLTWPGGEFALDGVGAALARPETTFVIESFEATSEEPEQVTLSLTVRNTGDTQGWSVGALNRRGPSVVVTPVTGVALAADPGATATWTDTNGVYGAGTAEYTLRGAGDGDHVTTAEVAGEE